MFKRTIAYLEGNSCRDVVYTHFENNAALFEKAFELVCFVVFFSVIRQLSLLLLPVL